MNESNFTAPDTPPLAARPEDQPARTGPFARVINVIFSPGAVFEDVRRSCSGWWAPILVGAVVTATFGSIYVAKYDIPLVVGEQIRSSSGMKLLSNLMGPEARDKAVEAAVKQIEVTPAWQLQVSQWVQNIGGWALVIWFFTFLYSLMAMAMGWLGEARGSRLFISLGLIVAIAVGYIAVGGALQIAHSVSMKQAGANAQEIPIAPTPTWMALVSMLAGLAAAGLCVWVLARLAREPVFGRIIAVVSLAAVPGIIAALVGILIVLIRTPDATPQDQLVPASLTGLLNLKGDGPLVALLSSLNLFTLWSIALTIVGLAKVLGKRVGQAAALVLIPWGLWVLVKVTLAAIF